MIPLIKSTFFNEAGTKKKLAVFIRESSKLSFGSECEKFERKFSAWQGRRDTIFVNSGSSANLALFQALLNLGRLKPGDLVGFSALTWSTNVMPLIQLGLIPVPIDVELETLNISSRKFLEALIRHRLKALFTTNLLGFCDDLEKIKEICRRRKIILLEDNCEALGSVYKKKKLGNFGLASTFSFFVGHHLSTIEGGAIATDDKELANMLRIVRAHGWDRHLTLAVQGELRRAHQISDFYAQYTFYDLGYNLRPTEVNGFLGNSELRYAGQIVKKRNENFLRIAKVIHKKTSQYFPIQFRHLDLASNFAVPVICRTKKIHSELIKKCAGKIEIRPIVGGDITSQPFFAKYAPEWREKFKKSNARLIHEQGLYFGNNPQLTKKEISEIIKVFTG